MAKRIRSKDIGIQAGKIPTDRRQEKQHAKPIKAQDTGIHSKGPSKQRYDLQKTRLRTKFAKIFTRFQK